MDMFAQNSVYKAAAYLCLEWNYRQLSTAFVVYCPCCMFY